MTTKQPRHSRAKTGAVAQHGEGRFSRSQFLGELEEHAVRMTHARRLIASTFWRTEGHLTAESLHRLVRREKSDVSLATVYRTLRLLCEAGLAEEHKFPGGVSYYEHRAGHAHHDHLICVECGEVREFHSESIERIQDDIWRLYSFRARGHTLQLYGVCASCAAKRREKSA